MNKILIYISVILFAFSVNAQNDEFNYSTDFDVILTQSKDSTSNFYYPKLIKRFHKNDSTLTNKEVLALMIGFTANENYKPYQNVKKEREILSLISEKKYEEALVKCNILLETNPLNYSALLEKGFALWKLNDDKYKFYKEQYFKLLDAIHYSGDGSQNRAIFVLSPMDGQTIIRYVWGGSIGTMGSGRDENGNFLDILEMEKDGKTLTIHFNIQHAMNNSEIKKQINKVIEEKKVIEIKD